MTVTNIAVDLDGTLIDSLPVWGHCHEQVIRAHGGPWPPLQVPYGSGSVAWTRAALPDCDAEAVAAEVHELVAGWFEKHGFTAMPGAQDFLAVITAPCALVTAAPARVTDLFLDWLGRDVFSAVVCAGDVTDTKPAPDPYLLAASLLGAEPADCTAVEDSPAGVISALAAGYGTVYGVGSHHPALAALGATGIPGLDDLSRLLSGGRP